MSRSYAREVVLKAIFQRDFQPEQTEGMYLDYINQYDLKENDAKYAKEMISGIIKNIEAIDKIINSYLVNWEVNRLNKIESAILRLATLEIIELKDIPAPVSISEAIHLTTKYSDMESVKYINAVLEKIAKNEGIEKLTVNKDEDEKPNRQ